MTSAAVTLIQSRDNALIKDLRRLAQDTTAYRKQGRVWLEGDHLCRALLARGRRPLTAVFTQGYWPAAPYDLRDACDHTVVIPEALMASLSGLESPAGVGFVWALPEGDTVQPGAAAVVLQASDNEEGVIGTVLGCDAESRQSLRVRGMGAAYANRGVPVGITAWDFDGQEIFKRAVHGMTEASQVALGRAGLAIGDIDLVVPHQANLRIIEFVGKRIGAPRERVFLTVERYGNMSAATVPVALVDAIEEGRVKPGARLLTPAFGGGLTFCAHVIQWGERSTPKRECTVDLPPCEQSALEIVRAIMAVKAGTQDAAAKLDAPLVA